MHMRDPGNAYLKSEKLNFQKKKKFLLFIHTDLFCIAYN